MFKNWTITQQLAFHLVHEMYKIMWWDNILINTLIVCPIFNQDILMSKNISIIDTCVFFFSHTQVSTQLVMHIILSLYIKIL